MEYLKIEKKNNFAILIISKESSMNSLNSKLLNEFIDALRIISSDSNIRGFIITGSGNKSFCAGADITELNHLSSDQAEDFARKGHKVMNLINNSDMISIAAVNGYALGGGLELALACDVRICSKNAKFGLPETGLGIIPGFGGTQRLPRIVKKGIALEMILSGESIDADRAYQIGLVNYVVDQENLLPKAEELMNKMLQYKGIEAQKIAKWLVHSGTELPLTASLEREIISFAEMFNKEESKIGIQAFLKKEKPDFTKK